MPNNVLHLPGVPEFPAEMASVINPVPVVPVFTPDAGPEPVRHPSNRGGFLGFLDKLRFALGMAFNPAAQQMDALYHYRKAQMLADAYERQAQEQARQRQLAMHQQELDIQRQEAEEQARHNLALESKQQPQKWERVETENGVVYVNPYTLEERPAGFQPKPQQPKTLMEALLSSDPAVQARARQAIEAEESIRAKYRRPENVAALNQAQTRLESYNANMDRLASAANELLHHPGIGGATGMDYWRSYIPGTDPANFRAKLQTLKSQIAFNVLQEMRNQAKTGGALGQVSDKEQELLMNNLAALDQSQTEDQFRQSLQAIVDYTEAAKRRALEAVQREVASPSSPASRKLFTTGQAERASYRYNPATGRIEPIR